MRLESKFISPEECLAKCSKNRRDLELLLLELQQACHHFYDFFSEIVFETL